MATDSSDAERRQQLLDRVRARRTGIQTYIRELNATADRETNLSIVSSAVAAVLTAGPALGGTSFTEGLAKALYLPDDSIVWRSLCVLAMLLALAGAISTNLYKQHDVANRLVKAEAASAQLDGLATTLEFGELPLADAVKLYQQYVSDISFIPE